MINHISSSEELELTITSKSSFYDFVIFIVSTLILNLFFKTNHARADYAGTYISVISSVQRFAFKYTYSRVILVGKIFFKILKSFTLHRIVSPQLHCFGQSKAKQRLRHRSTAKATREAFILRESSSEVTGCLQTKPRKNH